MSELFDLVPLDIWFYMYQFIDRIDVIMFTISCNQLYRQSIPQLKLNKIPRRINFAIMTTMERYKLCIQQLSWTYDNMQTLENVIQHQPVYQFNIIKEIFNIYSNKTRRKFHVKHKAIQWSIKYGNETVLIWALRRFPSIGINWDSDEIYSMINYAISDGNLDILTIVHTRSYFHMFPNNQLKKLWSIASKKGHLHIIKWLHIHLVAVIPEGTEKQWVFQSIWNNHIELFKWFTENHYSFDIDYYVTQIIKFKDILNHHSEPNNVSVRAFVNGFKYLQSVYGKDIEQLLPTKFRLALHQTN